MLMCVQGMDASGKDGLIKHVMSGVTRRDATSTHSSSRPKKNSITISVAIQQGRSRARKIGIFNRSYFEEVLVVRVHLNCSNKKHSRRKPGPALWKQRYEDINHFEEHLARNGTVILKFF